MINRLLAFLLLSAALAASPGHAQGPGGGPGPGPPPNPWQVIGNGIAYSTGGVMVGASVTGGNKGPGSLNVQSLYVQGVAVSPTAGNLAVGTTTVSGGISGYILYNNAGVLGNLATTGSGNVVLATSPTIASPTFSGTVAGAGTIPNSVLVNSAVTVGSTSISLGAAATTVSGLTLASPTFSGTVAGAGTIPNSVLVNSSMTVNSVLCTLGSSCSITATAASITVGTTSVASGTSGYVLYNNAGVLGNVATTGTGSVAFSNTPTFVTPILGAASGTSLNLSGLTASSAVATDASKNLVSVTNTGSGNNVLATSPTISGLTVTGSFTATGLVTNASLASASITVNGSTCTLGSSCTPAGPLNVGSSVVNSGSDQFILYNNAGVLGNVGTSGTGLLARVTSPNFTTPVLGAATATSVAIGGCTIGTSALCTTGSVATTFGVYASTNLTFQVDNSAGSAATGIKITSAAAASGASISVISSGTNENLAIDAKGSGTITLGGTSTGAITLTRATTHSSTTTLSGALTYGGVTLSNSVTGTGSMVLSAGPTFTGTLSSANHTITSTSANALAVGANGTTNPVLQIDASTGSVATGIKVTGAAAAGGVTVAAISSGTNENLSIQAKGSGTITVGGTSTGAITLGGASVTVNLGTTGSTTLNVGVAASASGTIVIAGSSSGSTTIVPEAAASGTVTIPAITDTLAGYALANGGTNNSLTASNGGVVYSDASKLMILAGTATAGQCLLSNVNSAPAWGSCSGAASVSSVSAGNGTLTISPTTGAVVAALNLSNANTWAAAQTFTNSGIILNGSSTGNTTFTSANASASNYTITFPAATGTLLYSGGPLGTPASATLTNATGCAVSSCVGGLGTGVATALGTAVSTAGGVPIFVAKGTSALGTSAISSGACATVVTTSATGTATTDIINASFNGDPTGVTGYVPAVTGMLSIVAYPTANNVNFKVCNNTASSITPGSITLNWVVVR